MKNESLREYVVVGLVGLSIPTYFLFIYGIHANRVSIRTICVQIYGFALRVNIILEHANKFIRKSVQ